MQIVYKRGKRKGKRKGQRKGKELSEASIFLRVHTIPRCSFCNVALSNPLASFHELYDVDELLGRHDGEGGDGQDPWDCAVHFVGSA